MFNQPPSQSAGGFSLIEVMIVVVLISIMATAAVTGLTQLVHSVRVKTAEQRLFSTLLLARSEAVKRNVDVTITPDAGNWSAGWRVESGGELILHQEALRGVDVTLGPDDVTFTHHGRLPDGVAVPQFQIASTTGDTHVTRCINLDLAGRPRTTRGEC